MAELQYLCDRNLYAYVLKQLMLVCYTQISWLASGLTLAGGAGMCETHAGAYVVLRSGQLYYVKRQGCY